MAAVFICLNKSLRMSAYRPRKGCSFYWKKPNPEINQIRKSTSAGWQYILLNDYTENPQVVLQRLEIISEQDKYYPYTCHPGMLLSRDSASLNTARSLDYEIHPCISPCGLV
jgi:hypothetical protein